MPPVREQAEGTGQFLALGGKSYAAGWSLVHSLDITSASRSSLLSRSDRMFGAIPGWPLEGH